MTRILRRFVEVVILPPAGPLWLAALGSLLLLTRWKRHGRWAIGFGLASIFLLSLPVVEGWLMASVDRYPALPAEGAWPEAQAIVVLGAGVQWGSEEWGYDAPGPMAVSRLRYAAHVKRETGLPLVVTGYTGNGMKEVMERDLGLPVSWIEDKSYDTWENATHTAALLRGVEGSGQSSGGGERAIKRVFVVTHFWHMPRAILAFRAAGFDPIPAPMGFSGPAPHATWLDQVRPQASPLLSAKLITREWVGYFWYRWLVARGVG